MSRTFTSAAVLAVSLLATAASAASFQFYDIPGISSPHVVVPTPDGNVWIPSGYDIARMTPAGDLKVFPAGFPSTVGGKAGIADMVLGPDGNLWFTAPDEEVIGRMTLAGVVTQFSSSGSGATMMPNAICTGPDGALWFTAGAHDRLGRITVQGAVTFPSLPSIPGYFPIPGSICAGPDGALWFTDRLGLSPRIGRLTTGGEGGYFSLPDGISEVTEIVAGPDGNLWFGMAQASSVSGSIARMTPAGVVTAFPTTNRVGQICVGADGNVWFTEPYGRVVGRVTMPGVVSEFPLSDVYAGELPEGIAAGVDGNLWISDRGRDLICSLSTAGSWVRTIPVDCGRVRQLAIGADGNTWFTDDCGRIGRLTPSGDVTGFLLSEFNAHPNAITPGPDGALWFLESYGPAVSRITVTGEITRFALPTPANDLVAGPDGNIWFAEGEPGKVAFITPAGALTEIPLPDPGFQPYRIASGGDGNLWLLAPNNRLGRMSPLGGWTEFQVPDTGMPADSLAYGADGAIWLTAGYHWVVRVVPGVGVTTFRIATPDGLPRSIVATIGGDLWFGEQQGNRLGRISLDGDLTETPIPLAPGAAYAIRPGEVTVSPRGDVWFVAGAARGPIGVLRMTEPTSFFTIAPCRLVDTRNPEGSLGGPSLAADGRRPFTVVGDACGIPSDAQSVSANITVTGASAGGRLSIFGTGESNTAGASRVEFRASRTRACNAILRLATDGSGQVTVHSSAAGPVDFILDVNGYFRKTDPTP